MRARKYIFRVDTVGCTPGWRVKIELSGQRVYKAFRDDEYSGTRKSLRAAKEYRDKCLLKMPPSMWDWKNRDGSVTWGKSGYCNITITSYMRGDQKYWVVKAKAYKGGKKRFPKWTQFRYRHKGVKKAEALQAALDWQWEIENA